MNELEEAVLALVQQWRATALTKEDTPFESDAGECNALNQCADQLEELVQP